MLLSTGCGQSKPQAVLHGEDETGYISCSKNLLNVDIESSQAFVYDLQNGKFVFIKGENEILYPASTTKLLTIIFALTVLELDALVTPTDELDLVMPDSSIAYIKKNHILTVEMLIEGMLLPSGNDAAYVLAAAAGKVISGDKTISGKEAVDVFINGMNNYGQKIGLCGSNFITPDGYYNQDHYSTVEDMAIISLLAYNNDLIMKYAGVQKDSVVYASGHTNTWENTNLMLDGDSEFYSPYVTGLKTGSAGKGNYCFICTFEKESQKYIAGVFSSESNDTRFSDMLKIVDLLMN